MTREAPVRTEPHPTKPTGPGAPKAQRRHAPRRDADTFPLEPHPTNTLYALFYTTMALSGAVLIFERRNLK